MKSNGRNSVGGCTVSAGWSSDAVVGVLATLASLADAVRSGRVKLVGRGGPQKRALAVTTMTLQQIANGSRLLQHFRMLCGAFGLDGRGTVQIVGTAWDQGWIWNELKALLNPKPVANEVETTPTLTLHPSVAAAA